jgi:hypothetical protein
MNWIFKFHSEPPPQSCDAFLRLRHRYVGRAWGSTEGLAELEDRVLRAIYFAENNK